MSAKNPNQKKKTKKPGPDTAKISGTRKGTREGEGEGEGEDKGKDESEQSLRKKTTSLKETKNNHPYIVGLGSSAGGLEALQNLLQNIPVDGRTSASYIVAQHLSPQHKSMLTELLAKETALRVVLAENKAFTKAGTVYITPPNTDIEITADGKIHLTAPNRTIGPKPCVDRLLRSLAKNRGSRAIGVILSGTGTDGASGIKAIRAAGGITVAQLPESAKYAGMPEAAIATTCIDTILAPEKIGSFIEKTIQTGYRTAAIKVNAGSDLESVLNIVKKRTGHSFHGYKTTTLKRRLQRRMVACGISGLKDYIEYLESKEEEAEYLARDFLISVTEFFRDREVFGDLKEILANIISDRQSQNACPGRRKKNGGYSYSRPVRLWSVGCATGEEAYSLAMLYLEVIGGVDKLHKNPVQIFATDIDSHALAYARAGKYPLSAAADIPSSYLEDYFICYENECEILKQIKDILLFSNHNILSNPPFSRIDLIVCRNLLIYFSPQLQEKAFRVFHYANAKNGYLFLGKSESATGSGDLYTALQERCSLYQRRDTKPNPPSKLLLPQGKRAAVPPRTLASEKQNLHTAENNLVVSLVKNFAPDSVLVDQNLNIVHIYGHVAPFMKIRSGRPPTNLSAVILPDLQQELKAFVQKAYRTGEKTETRWREVSTDGGDISFSVAIYPLETSSETTHLLISFKQRAYENLLSSGKSSVRKESFPFQHDSGSRVNAQVTSLPPGKLSEEEYDHKIHELESELNTARKHLQMIVEELETSNEELQSLNEELQSSNEELQSTNEELETSNEELQSTNEELSTVNDELSQKKKELESSNEELKNIKNSINFPLIRIDENMVIVKTNLAARETFSLPPTDGKLYLLRVLPRQLNPEKIAKFAGRVLDNEQVQILRLQYKKRSYWLQLLPYKTKNGQTTGVILTFIDETEDLDNKRRLRDSQERYNALASTTDIPIYIKDARGKYLTANLALQRMLGKTEEEILGKTDAALFGRSSGRIYRHNDLQVYQKGQALTFEETVKKEGGRTGSYLSIKSPLFDDEGKIYATSGISIDITDRNDYLEQLRLYKSVIDNAHDIVVITDASPIGKPGPRIRYVNRAFEKLTGYSAQEVIGKTPRLLQGPETDRIILGRFRQALKDKEPFYGRLLNYGKDGQKYILEINMVPVKDKEGHTRYFAAVQRDITQRIEYERELENSNRKILKANKVKSDFLANMSHEIRTPMNAVCGISDLLRNFSLTEDKKNELIRQLGTSAGQLKELLDDILDYSKLEAGELRLHHTEFNLPDLLSEVADINAVKAEEKGLELRFPKRPRIPHTFIGDKTRIKQILLNLVSNAIKFTDKGYVELSVKKVGDLNEGKILLCFQVRDTGIGISADQQKHIFRKFSQGNISLDKKIGGTGLGLTISKRLATRMNGKLGVKSTVGKGTVFSLELPLAPAKKDSTLHSRTEMTAEDSYRTNFKDAGEKKSRANVPLHNDKKFKPTPSSNRNEQKVGIFPAMSSAVPEPDLRGKVLIVEDTLTNIEILSLYLEHMGVSHDIALNATEALEKILHESYTLILLDLQMPDMDGFSLTQQIRSLKDREKAAIPIVAVTAHAEKSIRHKCLEFKMNDFMSKPLDYNRLVEVLRRFALSKEA